MNMRKLLILIAAVVSLSVYAQDERVPQLPQQTTKLAPVKTAAQLYHLGGDTIEVVVRIMVHPDHVIFSNVDPAEQHLTTDVRINAPKGFKKLKGMTKPVRQQTTTGTNTYTYQGDCIFRQKYKGNAEGDFKVTIKYECMNAQHEVFQPESVDYTLKQ